MVCFSLYGLSVLIADPTGLLWISRCVLAFSASYNGMLRISSLGQLKYGLVAPPYLPLQAAELRTIRHSESRYSAQTHTATFMTVRPQPFEPDPQCGYL